MPTLNLRCYKCANISVPQQTALYVPHTIHRLWFLLPIALLNPLTKGRGSLKTQFWKMEQAFLLRTKKPNFCKLRQSPAWLSRISGTMKALPECSHLLAIFTLEAKKHSFPTDCAGLRHPVLGGKPVGKKQKTFKGKVVVTGLSLEG